MPAGPLRSAELRMDPRDLPVAPYKLQSSEGASIQTSTIGFHLTQVDVSTQVDLNDGNNFQRSITPLYSREDIKEQYCITNRQLVAVEKSAGGIFGCLTSRGPSPCSSSTKTSILSACVRSAPSDENLFDAPYPNPHQMRSHNQTASLRIMYQQPYSTYPRHPARFDSYGCYSHDNEDDRIKRRPKSFYSVADHKRYTWLPEDEDSTRMEGPRSVLPPLFQQKPSALHTEQQQQQSTTKSKHVSFARSHTLTSFDVSHTESPIRPHNQERLIDSQPTVHCSMAALLRITNSFSQPEARIFVLEKQPKRGTMKAQATQTDIGPGLRGRIAPVILSPRTIHRVKMVSQGAQTNGIFNGRKLTKSYSEAGQLSFGPTDKEENSEHEPLQRTQSEEPPKSPFVINTPIYSPKLKTELPKGDADFDERLGKMKELKLDDEEILIDFKPAPVSPNAQALLDEMVRPYRRYIMLQKTLSDGEIPVERRELINETSESNYPHTCSRNYQDPWNRKLHAPLQFSSTPEDLSFLRVISPLNDHNDEEFHENFIHRGLCRKRSVSLEDGVQIDLVNEYILPRSLPTSPTSSNFYTVNTKSRDHSDDMWNESQTTVLQAESLTLRTPSSKRRHLLILQHQQQSSMDTDTLDIETDLSVNPSSPQIQIETSTPITITSSTNGRPRKGFLRRDLGSSVLQLQSESPIEFGLNRSANISIVPTTGISTTTNSLYLPTPLSGPISAIAIATDNSFENTSSIYNLARSEPLRSPIRSTSSSSSGSYDLEDSMPDTIQELFKPSMPGSVADQQEGHQSSSGGYAESPTELQIWSEEECYRQKKSLILDFLSGEELINGPDEFDLVVTNPASTINEVLDLSPTYGHRSRIKSATIRSSYRNNKCRSFETSESSIQSLSTAALFQHQLTQNSQKKEQPDEVGHVQTSDDSSCGHHCHLHNHNQHFHINRETSESITGRYRRTRESSRRKSNSHASAKLRSNEDKNAALTGSLPRRRSRAVEYMCSNRLSMETGSRYNKNSGHNTRSPIIIKYSSPEVRLKAFSAESLRSVSPGSDSVFYNVEDGYLDRGHCHHCGREVLEGIVQPPAGFADLPEIAHRSTSKHIFGQRLFKKFDKRYRSEDSSQRRHRQSSIGQLDERAKSEERGVKSNNKYGEELNTKRLYARSTEASMEILTGREDEDVYIEPYTSSEWIYIGDFEESRVWKRPNGKDGNEELQCYNERRGSEESTHSERTFRKKYQAATHRMVHRKSSGEMYKRIQTKCFESDKRVVVKRKVGGEFGFRIHGSKPVVVSAIEPDTPAESSGLEVGDIVMSINGKSVMEVSHSEVVRLAHSGSNVLELEVARTFNVLAPQIDINELQESKQEPLIHSGYLWRKARSVIVSPSILHDKWVRRWFVLRPDNCLYYYKSDTDLQPVGAVMLLKYVIELTQESRPYSFAIRKCGAFTLHLAADTNEATIRWCSIIREAIERNNKMGTWLEGSLGLQELPANMIQRTDCIGYLNKQHQYVRHSSSPTSWSRRYCILKDAVLYFYDDAKAGRAFGVACLHGFRVHGSTANAGGRKHAFEIQPADPTQRTYIFATDSEMDKKRWLAALEYSIDRWIKIG